MISSFSLRQDNDVFFHKLNNIFNMKDFKIVKLIDISKKTYKYRKILSYLILHEK